MYKIPIMCTLHDVIMKMRAGFNKLKQTFLVGQARAKFCNVVFAEC